MNDFNTLDIQQRSVKGAFVNRYDDHILIVEMVPLKSRGFKSTS